MMSLWTAQPVISTHLITDCNYRHSLEFRLNLGDNALGLVLVARVVDTSYNYLFQGGMEWGKRLTVYTRGGWDKHKMAKWWRDYTLESYVAGSYARSH